MLRLTNLLCDHAAGNEHLRYGHTAVQVKGDAPHPVVVWGVTKACNLRCVHCYASADANPAPDELTDAEGYALLDDLRSFDVSASMTVQHTKWLEKALALPWCIPVPSLNILLTSTCWRKEPSINNIYK